MTINILDSLKACGNYNLCKTQNGKKKTSKVRDFLKEIKIEKNLRSMGYSEISFSRKLLTVNIFVKTKKYLKLSAHLCITSGWKLKK